MYWKVPGYITNSLKIFNVIVKIRHLEISVNYAFLNGILEIVQSGQIPVHGPYGAWLGGESEPQPGQGNRCCVRSPLRARFLRDAHSKK